MNHIDEIDEKIRQLGFPDPHFGSNDVMLEWCREEGLTPIKYKNGEYNWNAVWTEYLLRPEKEYNPPANDHS